MVSLAAPAEWSTTLPRRISQGQLNLLTTCPRKFQHTYLDGLVIPETTEQQERCLAGSHFHLLMQQWQMGLPIAAITQEDAQLAQWFTAFQTASPQILALETESPDRLMSQSEQERSLEMQGYRLTVIYDLILTGSQQARILDWKTYPKPQTSRWLVENWQTRLYLFVLAETSSYQPEQLSMVYWFFQAQGRESDAPQSLQISYNQTQHEQTRQDLGYWLNQLTEWLAAYQAGQSFPQQPPGSKVCETCVFATRCDRTALALSGKPAVPAVLLNLADIPEIPL